MRKANYPCKGCCGKRYSCFCWFKETFSSLEQQTRLLEKIHHSYHYKVKSQNNNSSPEIDSMFFPAVDSNDPLSDENNQFKNLPTIIICNPNGLFYQDFVSGKNLPEIKLFLNLKINVMTWNYRGYGLTKGTTSPSNIKSDAEEILNFVKNVLGVKGKIGVFGRSLGGIASTHLA